MPRLPGPCRTGRVYRTAPTAPGCPHNLPFGGGEQVDRVVGFLELRGHQLVGLGRGNGEAHQRGGGTSISRKEPDMESLPPMAAAFRPIWADRAPSRAAKGLPQRWGSSRNFSKYPGGTGRPAWHRSRRRPAWPPTPPPTRRHPGRGCARCGRDRSRRPSPSRSWSRGPGPTGSRAAITWAGVCCSRPPPKGISTEEAPMEPSNRSTSPRWEAILGSEAIFWKSWMGSPHSPPPHSPPAGRGQRW